MRTDCLLEFNLARWLASQDVTDRDETLDERSARVHALHQTLVRPEGGLALARRIADSDVVAVVRDIVLQVDCDEPRFAPMVLVDVIGALREGQDEDDDLRRLAGTIEAAARAVPLLFRTIDKRARKGDVCEDTMYYCLTLLSFLLAEDHVLAGAERIALRITVVDTTWLKASMRLWKEDDIVGHVPGLDSPDHDVGLGAVVSTFLHRIVHGGEISSERDIAGARALAKLGSWLVSHIVLRLYNSSVGSAERKRLIDILYACCTSDPLFSKLVWDDAETLQAICDSVRSFPLTHGVLERFDEEGEEAEGEELATKVVTRSIQNCTGAFVHLRLLQRACMDAELFVDRRSSFFSLCGSNIWFWKAVHVCVKHLEEASLYNGTCGKSCDDLWVAPCCITILSNILWGIMKWLVAMADSRILTVGSSISTTRRILTQVLRVASKLRGMTRDSLVLSCTLALGEIVKAHCEAEALLSSWGGSPEVCHGYPPTEREYCEFCLKAADPGGHTMSMCSGCGLCSFCSQEHLRAHWKRAHKRACKGKTRESFACFDIQVDENGTLGLQNADIDDKMQSPTEENARILALSGALGPALASVGGGVICLEQQQDCPKDGAYLLRYLPRGKLLGSLNLSTAEAGVVAAMAQVCAQRGIDYVFIASNSLSGKRESTSLSLCRAAAPESKCQHYGCLGHDMLCTVAVGMGRRISSPDT